MHSLSINKVANTNLVIVINMCFLSRTGPTWHKCLVIGETAQNAIDDEVKDFIIAHLIIRQHKNNQFYSF
jgi:hypothetical protein